jgi:hypothetical protein
MEWNQSIRNQNDNLRDRVFVAELLASVSLAVIIGLGLRQI